MTRWTTDDDDPRPADARWLDPLLDELERSLDDYDAATLSRLKRARQAALAHDTQRSRLWLPLGLAAALSVALALGLWRALPQRTPEPALVPEDYAMLVDDGALELSEELAFYAWLDAQPASDG